MLLILIIEIEILTNRPSTSLDEILLDKVDL